MGSLRWDITATAADSEVAAGRLGPMLQAVLEGRFQLKVHRETRQGLVYILLPAKSGLKLPESNPAGCATFGVEDAAKNCDGLMVTGASIVNQKISMTWFADALSSVLKAPVIDRTGYRGSFRVDLHFAPIEAESSEISEPSVFTSVQEQSGLRLKPGKGPWEVLVIDHVERPSDN